MSEHRRLADADVIAELRRRSTSPNVASDLSVRDFVAGVDAKIDSGSNPATPSRVPALVGLAGAAGILLVLVVAGPQVGPGASSPRPTPEAPPSTITAMGVGTFAARLASGELNGQQLMIVGEVSVEPRRGPVCPVSQDSLCYVGTLAGSAIDLRARPVPTAEGEGAAIPIGESSWRSWRLPSPPMGIARTMAVSVDFSGVVELLGYTPPEEMALVMSEIQYIDFAAMPLDEVRVVSAWLTGIVAPISCAPPALGTYVPGLPGRYCSNPSWLADRALRVDPDGFRIPDDALQLQSDAYLEFAENPSAANGSAEPRAGAYVIAKRLEGGGCPAEPPCWQWEVIGRLTLVNDGNLAQPLATNTATPTTERSPEGIPPTPPPSTAVRFECLGPPLPAGSTPARGLLPAVIDETGLVESCLQTDFITELTGTISVSNPFETNAIEVVWANGVCDAAIEFTFRAVDEGFELAGERPTDCGAGGEPLPIYIRFSTPIAAQDVMASLDGVTGPPPSRTPTPISTTVQCSEPPPGNSWPAHPTIRDETGLIASCEAVAPSTLAAEIAVGNLDGDLRILQVTWAGVPCDASPEFVFRQGTGGYSLEGESTWDACILPLVSFEIRLHTRADVSADQVAATLRHLEWPNPSPSPPIAPPPDARTLSCVPDGPGANPVRVVEIVDNTGLVETCTATGRDRPDERIAVSNLGPDVIEVVWETGCSFTNARLELWPRNDTRGPSGTPIYSRGFALMVDSRPPTGPVGCFMILSGLGVELTMSSPVVASEIQPYLTSSGRGTDLVEHPAGPFSLSLSAGKPEYAVDEVIDVEATLLFEGASGVTISGDSSFVKFGFEQLDGTLSMGPVGRPSCESLDLESGVPYVVGYDKSGSFDPDGPDGPFYQQYFAEPEFHLPPGTYRIFADVGFALGGQCPMGDSYAMTASIIIRVR